MHQSTTILVTDYLTKMGIKTVPQHPYSPDLAPCDFCLFPKLKEKLRGCYDTIEEMKEAVMKVIDTLTQEDFHGVLQKLLEQYNKCIQLEEITTKGKSFICVLSKLPIRKKSLETYCVLLVSWIMILNKANIKKWKLCIWNLKNMNFHSVPWIAINLWS